MPKNIMKLIKPVHNQGRNAFDLSHRHLYGMNFGELIPSTFIETVPEDYIEVHASNLLRAIPMVTSPFLRAKQHIDLWFVPYEYLWANFNEFIVKKNNPHSANAYNYQYCPHASLKDIRDVVEHSQTLFPQSDYDVVGRDYSIGAKRLYDYCGYGRLISAPVGVDDPAYDKYPQVNLWRIAAYNKLWYDEYRQQYYDDGMRLTDPNQTSDINVAQLFNFDDLNCLAVSSANIRSSSRYDYKYRLRAMFQMRYRCWKKDLITGLLPSTQFGAVSSVSADLTSFSVDGVSSSDGASLMIAKSDGTIQGRRTINRFGASTSGGAVTSQFTAGTTDNLSALTAEGASSFDILDFRNSEALQIWRENALRAGNRISDNLRAHYGSEVDYDDHRATLLGSVDAPLNIGDIDATAQTGQATNGQLGDIAGKGLSTINEKVFKFKAKKFGVIVAIHSILPETEYESTGIDRLNQLVEPEDYFVSEYQNIGLEAVSSQTVYGTRNEFAGVIGYAPRYIAYKQKLDKCFKEFWSGQIFGPWASPNTLAEDIYNAISSNNPFPLSVLYVDPYIYNNNFSVSIDNSLQFLVDQYYQVDAVRSMSLIGLPQN